MVQGEDRSAPSVPIIRWLGHACGILAALFIAHFALATFFRSVPVPHVSGRTFMILYLAAIVLSVIAGLKASQWWFIVTGCLAALLGLIWVAEYYAER